MCLCMHGGGCERDRQHTFFFIKDEGRVEIVEKRENWVSSLATTKRHSRISYEWRKGNVGQSDGGNDITMTIIKNVKYTRAHHLTTEIRIQGFHRVASGAGSSAVTITYPHIYLLLHKKSLRTKYLCSHSLASCIADDARNANVKAIEIKVSKRFGPYSCSLSPFHFSLACSPSPTHTRPPSVPFHQFVSVACDRRVRA